MRDTHRLIALVCDGDRWPNEDRERKTVEDMIEAHRKVSRENDRKADARPH